MVMGFGTVVSIVLGTVIGVAALVAPLYIMVLRGYGDGEVAAEERGNLDDTQAQIEEELSEMNNKLDDIGTEVKMNAQRSETNQKHIHQLLLGKIDDDDNEIGNPHYYADNCPIPEECPFHTPESA